MKNSCSHSRHLILGKVGVGANTIKAQNSYQCWLVQFSEVNDDIARILEDCLMFHDVESVHRIWSYW